MKYTDKILKHPIYQKFQEDIKALETGRIYCHHEMEHAIDVARLAWIYYLEDHLSEDMQNMVGISVKKRIHGEWTAELEETKDLFYMAALLHDIGRAAQYETGIHHSVAGLAPAREILRDIEVPEDWIAQIMDVIAEHGDGVADRREKRLEYYIARADHDCRLCFACEAKDSCKWTQDERNHSIVS